MAVAERSLGIPELNTDSGLTPIIHTGYRSEYDVESGWQIGSNLHLLPKPFQEASQSITELLRDDWQTVAFRKYFETDNLPSFAFVFYSNRPPMIERPRGFLGLGVERQLLPPQALREIFRVNNPNNNFEDSPRYSTVYTLTEPLSIGPFSTYIEQLSAPDPRYHIREAGVTFFHLYSQRDIDGRWLIAARDTNRVIFRVRLIDRLAYFKRDLALLENASDLLMSEIQDLKIQLKAKSDQLSLNIQEINIHDQSLPNLMEQPDLFR